MEGIISIICFIYIIYSSINLGIEVYFRKGPIINSFIEHFDYYNEDGSPRIIR